MNGIKEQDILDKSKLALKALLNNDVSIREASAIKGSSNFDGYLIINQFKFPYLILSKSTFRRFSEKIKNISNQFLDYNERPIIILDYASKEIVNHFKNFNLFFLDSIGNCYINSPSLKIIIEGRKNDFIEPTKTKRAFQKTGLKLIYCLLTDVDLTNENYREIVERTGISLASIGYIFDELKEDKFIIEISNNRRKLSNLKRLITKWADSYVETLRPKIHRGLFTFINEGNVKIVAKNIYNRKLDTIHIGGEYAAFFLNGSIKPGKLTLYTNERLSTMARDFGIVPVNKYEEGKESIEILEKFWINKKLQSPHLGLLSTKAGTLTHPILTYSDLISSNDFRSIETAENLLNNEIRNRFIEYNFQW